ncbi:GABA-gated chloride channel isoform a3 [Operophtera brumata]|uniref:Gamma-aminobutyric acid receptor subunit beta n=1 Tax=Operophtera brumata TaxID=104452 RepID=A0A0L7LI29_OPEBR|nr:GABA-gated chloride channel isoform a3 [Operophtera brumata]
MDQLIKNNLSRGLYPYSAMSKIASPVTPNIVVVNALGQPQGDMVGTHLTTRGMSSGVVEYPGRDPPYHKRGAGGGGMFGDVNISAILDSFSIRPPVEVGVTMYVLSISSLSEVKMVPFSSIAEFGPPVEVGVTMYVLSISSVSEVLMDFTLDFYFRQFWTDPRLAYKKRTGVETLSVGSEFIKNIWVPDTFFVNEKQSYFHIATTSNEFIRIHYSGSITRSIRLTITASCPMNLQYFPMDRQLCHIEIESCNKSSCSRSRERIAMLLSVSDSILCVWHVSGVGYTMRDIRYLWKDGLTSVGMSNEVQLPQFRVLGHRQRATVVTLTTVGYTMRDIRYKWNEGPNSVGVSSEVSLPQFKVLGHRQRAMEISLTTGNYSRLACEIQFVRSMGYYLIQIYIPSGLIVIISWVSFWLNRNATPARVALGVTTVLTMTTLMSSTNAALPKISYVKSIDVYLGTCFVMVFASLLEYATVGYMAKRIQMRKQRFVAIQKIASEKKMPVDCPPEVRFKVHDPKAHSKGGTLENTINGGRGGAEEENAGAGHILHPTKDISKLLGMTPSDIDKYSRIVFPVCFVCFNLMYWIIYLHVSDVVADDLVLLEEEK